MAWMVTYRLTDTRSDEERREILESQGVDLNKQNWKYFGNPFAEVDLVCLIDDEGRVTVEEVDLN